MVVPAAGGQANAGDASGWVWWAEKDDLVVGFHGSGSADAIIAALDGKTPSAVEHELVKELAKREGKFEPVCFGFADPAVGTGSSSNGLATLLHSLKTERGVDRVDLRWGFEGDALLSVVRLVSCQASQGAARCLRRADFQQDIVAADARSDQLVRRDVGQPEAPGGADQADGAIGRGQGADRRDCRIDQGAGSIDLEKDVLGHLGPRMVAYLAPGDRRRPTTIRWKARSEGRLEPERR